MKGRRPASAADGAPRGFNAADDPRAAQRVGRALRHRQAARETTGAPRTSAPLSGPKSGQGARRGSPAGADGGPLPAPRLQKGPPFCFQHSSSPSPAGPPLLRLWPNCRGRGPLGARGRTGSAECSPSPGRGLRPRHADASGGAAPGSQRETQGSERRRRARAARGGSGTTPRRERAGPHPLATRRGHCTPLSSSRRREGVSLEGRDARVRGPARSLFQESARATRAERRRRASQ